MEFTLNKILYVVANGDIRVLAPILKRCSMVWCSLF